MPRPTLVTGAAGFAGSHLLDLLAGSPFQAASSAGIGPAACRRRPAPSVTWEAVDLLDRSSVIDAIARLKPATVYHCAGAAHVGQAWERTEATFATNVRGTHHLLDGLVWQAAEPACSFRARRWSTGRRPSR